MSPTRREEMKKADRQAILSLALTGGSVLLGTALIMVLFDVLTRWIWWTLVGIAVAGAIVAGYFALSSVRHLQIAMDLKESEPPRHDLPDRE